MDRYLVTTTIRNTRPGQASGCIYTIDLEGRRVTSQCPVIAPPHLEADPNPRGGMRGAKGIAFDGESAFLANASVVHRFDTAWNCRDEVTHPSCATIHDVLWHDGGLWVTSCSNDLLFQFTPNGFIRRLFDFRDCPSVQQALGWRPPVLLSRDALLAGAVDFRDPRSHQHETHDGGHVNSICVLPNGDLLVLLGLLRTRRWNALLRLKNALEQRGLWPLLARLVRPALGLLPLRRVPRSDVGVSLAQARAAVLRIRPNGAVEVARVLTGRRVPTHSLAALPDGTALLNDTTDGCIEHWDPNSGAIRNRVKVTDEFLRGLQPLAGGLALAGSQRDVLLVDLAGQRVLDRIRLSENPHVSVYDIKPLPDAFCDLPERLDAPAQNVGSNGVHGAFV